MDINVLWLQNQGVHAVVFEQQTWFRAKSVAALLKQVPKTLLGETPPSSTASIPDMLLSNRHRYSEVGLSSPEQMDWISAQVSGPHDSMVTLAYIVTVENCIR